MSIRKHYVPDFRQLLDSISEHGFIYLDFYRKAEALIGDSLSIALINLYFKDEDRRKKLQKYKTQPHIKWYMRFFTEYVYKLPMDQAVDRSSAKMDAWNQDYDN